MGIFRCTTSSCGCREVSSETQLEVISRYVVGGALTPPLGALNVYIIIVVSKHERGGALKVLLHLSRVDSRGDALLFLYRLCKRAFLPEERKK